MTGIKNLSLIKILLFIPFFATVVFCFFQFKKYRLQAKRQSVNQFVGKEFAQLPLYDMAGKRVIIDLNSTKRTIVDFWFRNCPGCIYEMKQFEEVLNGKEKDISIVSVSIDPGEAWRQTLDGKIPAYSFITKPLQNWHHLLLKYSDVDQYSVNASHLSDSLGVSSFPAYFVLDKKGIIQATPASAVNYIKTSLGNENEFFVFLKSAATWRSLQTIILVLLSVILYNFLFNYFASRFFERKV